MYTIQYSTHVERKERKKTQLASSAQVYVHWSSMSLCTGGERIRRQEIPLHYYARFLLLWTLETPSITVSPAVLLHPIPCSTEAMWWKYSWTLPCLCLLPHLLQIRPRDHLFRAGLVIVLRKKPKHRMTAFTLSQWTWLWGRACSEARPLGPVSENVLILASVGFKRVLKRGQTDRLT